MEIINKLLALFIVGIIGVIGVGIIAGQIVLNTAQIATTDESINIAGARIAANNINTSYTFTLTNAPTGWELSDSQCQINGFVLTNSTGSVLTSSNYTLTAGAGTFVLANTSQLVAQTSNTTLADYTYCGDGYLASSFGRSGLNMVNGFFALFILVIFVGGVYYVIQQFRE